MFSLALLIGLLRKWCIIFQKLVGYVDLGAINRYIIGYESRIFVTLSDRIFYWFFRTKFEAYDHSGNVLWGLYSVECFVIGVVITVHVVSGTCMCARRIAALETAQSQQPSQHQVQPHLVNTQSPAKQKGLSKKDAVIAERLQKLKDATKPGFTAVLLFCLIFVCVLLPCVSRQWLAELFLEHWFFI